MSSGREYLEDRAVLSDHEEDDDHDDRRNRRRRRRDNDVDDEDSENDEDVPDHFEKDGFVVDEDDEEEEEEDDDDDDDGRVSRGSERRKKRRRIKKVGETKRHEAEELERELHELQADHLIHRSRFSGRHHEEGRDDYGDDYGDDEERRIVDEGQGEMFDDEEGEGEGGRYWDRQRGHHRRHDHESSGGDMGGFIVGGARGHHARHYDDRAQIVRDIFGDDDEEEEDEDQGVAGYDSGYGMGRRRRQRHYDDDDEEEEDEYGYEDDYMDYPDERHKGEPMSAYESLRKTFGEEALEQRFMTERDEEIREADEPERIQLRQGFREVSDEEVREEAQWIFHAAGFDYRINIQMSSTQFLSSALGSDGNSDSGQSEQLKMERERCITAIENVLLYMLREKFDVPFISHYRKEYFETTLRNDEDLWKIFDYDEKWCQLKEKKQKLEELCDKVPHVDSFYRDLLRQARTIEEVNDLAQSFRVKYSNELSKPGASDDPSAVSGMTTVRRPNRRDRYTMAKRNEGVVKVARAMAITSEQYAENLFWSSTRHNTEDPDDIPVQEAEKYLCAQFRNAASVLAAARHINAKEIADEPFVRNKIRAAYEMNATLSTKTTDLGKRVTMSGFRRVSNIENRPLNMFSLAREDDAVEFMNIIKAEKDGLITISINIDNAVLDQCLSYNDLYCSIASDERAQKWNEQRRLVMEEVKKMVHEPMAQHILTKYTAESSQVVAMLCGRELERKVMQGPVGLTPSGLYPRRYKRVLACCPSMGDEMTSFVVLDENEHILATLPWTFDENAVLNARGGREAPIAKVEAQIKNFRALLEETKPEVIAVAITGKNCRKLYDFVREQADELLRDGYDGVHFVPDDFARAYEHSTRGKQDFPEHQSIVRRAVSIGRRLVDPLTEIAGFFNMEKDIVNICPKMHPLQDYIPQQMLMNALEQTMYRVVCKVGVDINRIINHKHRQPVLQFVCGLGPRKAAHVIKCISNLPKGMLEARQELAEVIEGEYDDDDIDPIMGPRVFRNCAGFIKVQNEYGEARVSPFDRTRVHPESYELAQQELIDAFDLQDINRHDIQDLMDEIRHQRSRLENLDLDTYADQLEPIFGKKHITLKDIARELVEPFKEVRPPYTELSDEEVFYAAIGESRHTLRVNMVVPVSVTHVRRSNASFGVFPIGLTCVLDNGIIGFVEREYMEGEREYQEGETLDAVIVEIVFREFKVQLDVRPSAVREKKSPEEQEEEAAAAATAARRQRKKPRKIVRNINHPSFHNFDHDEAMAYLKDKEPGEVVIRPSSRGFDYLAISFKIFGDTCINLNVKEEKKADRFSLGKELIVYNKTYEDLDEILFRCVEPMMDFVKMLTSHEKFVNVKSDEELERILKDEKQKNPKGIPYRIVIDRKRPGRFLIAYLPRRRIKNVRVTISPDGYEYMKRTFQRPSKLINAFKLSIQARLQKQTRGRRHGDDDDDDNADRRRHSERTSSASNGRGGASSSGSVSTVTPEMAATSLGARHPPSHPPSTAGGGGGGDEWDF